jgi:hypothetical protein
MAKLTAWLVTLIGVLMVLALVTNLSALNSWLIPVLVLVIGVGKLARNYSSKRK